MRKGNNGLMRCSLPPQPSGAARELSPGGIREVARLKAAEVEESLGFLGRMWFWLSERQVKNDGAELVKPKSLLLTKLADQLLKISTTKSTMWISQQGRLGVLNWLLEDYPVKGLSASSSPEDAADAYREASGPAHCERKKAFEDDLYFLSLSWEAETLLHDHLSSFCSRLALEINKSKRLKNIRDAIEGDDKASSLLRNDRIGSFQRVKQVKRLCRFCWRPVRSDHGERCCDRHSQIADSGGYKFADRRGMRTPAHLEMIFEFGMHSSLKIVPGCMDYPRLESLVAMRKDWSGAVSKGIAQAFEDDLAGKTHRALKSAAEYAAWGDFFDDICSAFEVSMPDDVDYLAIVIPYAIEEVEQEKARTETRKNQVIELAKQLSKTGRGWQTKIAVELDVSRQYVSATLKSAGFAA